MTAVQKPISRFAIITPGAVLATYLFLLAPGASAQMFQPAFQPADDLTRGLDCECTADSLYVAQHQGVPAAAVTLETVTTGYSPDSTYFVTATPVGETSVNLVIEEVETGRITFNNQFPSSNIGWGFSRDNHRFVVHFLREGTTSSPSSHRVELYDLEAGYNERVVAHDGPRQDFHSAQVRFSNRGHYLLYVALSDASTIQLRVFHRSGELRHEDDFSFGAGWGDEGDRVGNATWGFSRDRHDRSLVYAYSHRDGGLQWKVVNLATATVVASQRASTVVSGFWRFSPCGDVAALVVQQSQTQMWIALLQTRDGQVIHNEHYPVFWPQFVVEGAEHVIRRDGVDTYRLVNTAVQSCEAPGVPVALASLSLSESSVTGGETSSGTVTLDGAAPEGGVSVALSSSNSGVASVPAAVTVPAGETTASFQVSTAPVDEATAVNVSASYDGVTKHAVLTVAAVALSAVVLDPDLGAEPIIGGTTVYAAARLTGPAPSGGALIELSTDHGAGVVPESITIYRGDREAWFAIETSGVASVTSITITATYRGVERSAELSLRPAELERISVSENVFSCPVGVTGEGRFYIGGFPIRGMIVLDGQAPPQGADISLMSSNAAATVPHPGTTVTASKLAAAFQIETAPVSESQPITITASYGKRVVQMEIMLLPAPVSFSITELEFRPRAINNLGQIAGRLDDAENTARGIVWHQGDITLRDEALLAADMNDFGQIAGPESGDFQGWSISNAGHVVGQLGQGPSHAAIRQADGALLDLNARIEYFDLRRALRTNNVGQIVGAGARPTDEWWRERGFLLNEGSFRELPFKEALAINDAGHVVGSVLLGDVPLLWHDGESTVIPTLDPIEAYPATFTRITNEGVITGTGAVYRGPDLVSNAEFNYTYAAYVTSGRTYDLSCLLPPDFAWQPTVVDINDVGQIIVEAEEIPEGGRGSHIGGQVLARAQFLLTPNDAVPVDLVLAQEGEVSDPEEDGASAYSVVVTNNASHEARSVAVFHQLSAVFEFESATSGQGTCSYRNGLVTCDVGVLGAGASTTVELTARPVAIGELELLVAVTSRGIETSPHDNVLVINVEGAAVVEASATVEAGYEGQVDLSAAGMWIELTEASDTSGSITVQQSSGVPENNDALVSITVQAPAGNVTPDTVLTGRYWTVKAEGLEGFTYSICLNVDGLGDGVATDSLVVVHRRDSSEDWMPLDTEIRDIDGRSHLCAVGLTSFSQFGFASAQVPKGTGSGSPEPHRPGVTVLHRNYPNPFNPFTTILYELATEGPVHLAVYDALGRQVAVLVDDHQVAGKYEVQFEGTGFPSGIYVYRLKHGDQQASRTMLLVR
jgi:hypothetical protein